MNALTIRRLTVGTLLLLVLACLAWLLLRTGSYHLLAGHASSAHVQTAAAAKPNVHYRD